MKTQTNQTHTPGPWSIPEVKPYDATPFPVSGGSGFRIAWANPHATSWGDGKAEANARLIAAAPELLEFAKQTLATYHLQGHLLNARGIEKRGKLEALIAKAEGTA